MGLFSRRKKKDVPAAESPIFISAHEHTWKDMPWYMETWWSGEKRTAGYKIIEPYICITCGERKNVQLEQADWSNISVDDREQYYKDVRKRYRKYLRPHAVVEDMINNILLVKDPGRLNMIEQMRGMPHQNVGTSAEMKQVFEEPKRDAPKIEVKEDA